jgi:Arginyl-tRNA synthetase
MHVGHLRGTIIGDAIVRVLEKLGHEVVRQNHVGDWGTQLKMLICYLQELQEEGIEAQPSALADLEKFYKAAKSRFDCDEEFAKRSCKGVVEVQVGNFESFVVWK